MLHFDDERWFRPITICQSLIYNSNSDADSGDRDIDKTYFED